MIACALIRPMGTCELLSLLILLGTALENRESIGNSRHDRFWAYRSTKGSLICCVESPLVLVDAIWYGALWPLIISASGGPLVSLMETIPVTEMWGGVGGQCLVVALARAVRTSVVCWLSCGTHSTLYIPAVSSVQSRAIIVHTKTGHTYPPAQ